MELTVFLVLMVFVVFMEIMEFKICLALIVFMVFMIIMVLFIIGGFCKGVDLVREGLLPIGLPGLEYYDIHPFCFKDIL